MLAYIRDRAVSPFLTFCAVSGRCPWLKKLDGSPITEDERAAGAEKV